jgi:EmrB/QacA subfamily drug resistance transporter
MPSPRAAGASSRLLARNEAGQGEQTMSEQTGAGFKGKRLLILGMMLTMMLIAMDSTIVATAVPTIVKDLGGFGLFPWLFSIYLLAQVITVPVFGKFGDVLGRRPILFIGCALFLGGSVLSGAAWSMVTLIVFRAVQGLGAGALLTMTTTVAADSFSLKERARVQGYVSSVWGVAAVAGPVLGGLFVDYATWRWIFYVNVPIGLAAMVLVARQLHEKVERKPHVVDIAGVVTLTAGAGLLLFAILQGGVAWSWSSPVSIVLLTLGAAIVVSFALIERRAVDPILPPWVFRRRLLLGANLATLMLGAVVIGLSSYLPTFAQAVLGTSPLVSGLALGAMSIGWPLAAAVSGSVYLSIGFRNTAFIGVAVVTAASIGLVALPATAPVLLLTGCAFVMGVGMGFSMTPVLVGAQSSVDWNQRGVVTGSVVFMRSIGSAFGAALYGSIVNSEYGTWVRHAPTALAGKIPTALNSASLILTGNAPGEPAVVSYLRHGLYTGVHDAFWATVLVAALAGVGVAVMKHDVSAAGPVPSSAPSREASDVNKP